MREKITFEERVAVKLDRTEAKPVESRTGSTEYMRVVDNDTRIMFAPAELEAAIKASGAEAGDLIQIDRLKQGRSTRWEVAILTEDPQPAAAPRRATPAAPIPAPRPAAAAPAAPRISDDAQLLASSYRAAIEATAEAERYAVEAGIRDLRFSDRETITRLAMTVYIARTKGAK